MPNTLPDTLDPSARFLGLLGDCLDHQTFVKLILGKYRGQEAGLVRVLIRQITLKNQACLSFVYRYRTKDVTKNLALAPGLETIGQLLATAFDSAHLQTETEEIRFAVNKKGKPSLQIGRATPTSVVQAPTHDRKKQRFLDLDTPFLVDLGVTNEQHQLIPSMARKWKQINKFIEVVAHAFESSALKLAKQVRVVDFGAGKGYLTFALEEYLRTSVGLKAQVTGIELREDLVRLCNHAARRLQLNGLSFAQGDIRSYRPAAIDIMVALHACDIATDYAIHMGIRAAASIIMCAPCCHKEIRPQMQSPPLLRPMLKHGIHLGQEAEMVTDSLRALLLEANGYETQVFEFIALEHTSKNKMILAVKRQMPTRQEELLDQIRGIKSFYGIREHCLETLLQAGPTPLRENNLRTDALYP